MKKMRSAIALALIAVMSMMLLGGCGPRIQVQPDGTPAASGGQAAAQPADAAQPVRQAADYVCRAKGGCGAVREWIEYIGDEYEADN